MGLGLEFELGSGLELGLQLGLQLGLCQYNHTTKHGEILSLTNSNFLFTVGTLDFWIWLWSDLTCEYTSFGDDVNEVRRR